MHLALDVNQNRSIHVHGEVVIGGLVNASVHLSQRKHGETGGPQAWRSGTKGLQLSHDSYELGGLRRAWASLPLHVFLIYERGLILIGLQN